MQRFDLGTELLQVVAAHRHVRNEHAHEGVEGSWRRRLEADLDELAARFDTLLVRWVRDEELRHSWRQHLDHNGAEPPLPALAEPTAYKGRRGNGSLVEVRLGRDDAWEVVIDGALAKRLVRPLLGNPAAGLPVPGLDGAATELFDAPAPALAAFASYASGSAGPPPWNWAVELYEDGLIDADFALTPRGRRFLASRGGAHAAAAR